MALAAAFNPHLEVFAVVRKHLVEHGFEYPRHLESGWVGSEIPKPALRPIGFFRGLNLSETTATFPHPLLAPPMQAYTLLLQALRRERAGPRGRPLVRTWSGFTRNTDTSIEAIVTPMRSGYYGLERKHVAVGYHVAEFVYLLSCLYPDSPLTQNYGRFYIVLDEGLVGIVDHEVIDAFGNSTPLEHEFDVGKLLSLRRSPSERMSKRATLWASIWNFVLKNGLDSDAAFMQALSHARWALPTTLAWDDSPYTTAGPGRPHLVNSNPARLRALRVEEAIEIIKVSPSISFERLKPRLMPFAISREKWRDEVGPLLQSTSEKRELMLEYLQNLYEDLMAQA